MIHVVAATPRRGALNVDGLEREFLPAEGTSRRHRLQEWRERKNAIESTKSRGFVPYWRDSPASRGLH
jgi:hypothetical protein